MLTSPKFKLFNSNANIVSHIFILLTSEALQLNIEKSLP